MDEKKVVRNSINRQTTTEKLKLALAKKPTSAYLGQKGMPAEQLNSQISSISNKQNVQKNTVRNGRKKRFANKPSTVKPSEGRSVSSPAIDRLLAVPEWFSSKGPVDISIIIPMFRSKDVIEEQIKTWDMTDDGLTKEIIYVDDACPNYSYQTIVQSWSGKNQNKPVGKIILHNKNGGFAQACNTGAKYASGKYLLFLNADTTTTPNWIKPLYDSIQDETIGIVGNMQIKKDGSIDSCGSEWDWASRCFLHIGRHSYKNKILSKPFNISNLPEDLKQPHDVEMVTGCCFIISKDLFEKVDKFNINYRIGYWEDSDLNMKVHAFGYRIHFQPKSVIYHKLSHSGTGYHSFMNENKKLFMSQWVDTHIIDGFLTGTRPNQIKKITVAPKTSVIYTAITGNYDVLKVPPKISCGTADLVAFLENEPTSESWQYKKVNSEFKDPNRNAKIHKIMPHLFFPDKEYSLWVDGSVKIEFPYSIEKLIEIYLSDVDLAIFRHSDRNCVYQEANVCIQRKLDNADVIRNQINRYTQEGYPSNNGLAEATVILRRHTKAIEEFDIAWWNEIVNGSKRDQISFNYVAHKMKLKFRYFPGSLRKKNYLFSRDQHNKAR